MRILAVLSVFALCACASAPPLRTSDAAGSVSAWSAADAERVHAMASALAPRVAALLGVEQQPFVIRIVHGKPSFAGIGAVRGASVVVRDDAGHLLDRYITLGDDAQDAQDELERLLAHELVHWLVHDTLWEKLPLALEEGLAGHVAMQLVPDARTAHGHALHDAAWMVEEPGEWERLLAVTQIDEQSMGIYPLGAFLIERCGLEELRALCRRAEEQDLERVPPDQLLAAARLGGDEHERKSALKAWSARVHVRFFDADGNEIADVASAGGALDFPAGATHVEVRRPGADGWFSGRVRLPTDATSVIITPR